jgi:hypothetical protein
VDYLCKPVYYLQAGINEVNHALELKANAADVDKKLKDKASKKSVTECVSFKSKVC